VTESALKENRAKDAAAQETKSYFGLVIVLGLLVLLAISTGFAGVIVVLSLVIMLFLHELGHYLAARKAGMKVTEFFIGFGPKIWSFKRGETEYGIKGIPAGAYVRVIGMNNLDPVPPEDEQRTYRNAKFGQRLLLATAGSLMHFLIAIILLYAVLVGSGIQTDESDWTVQDTRPNGPAEIMGIEEGDRIIALNGVPITDWWDFAASISGLPDQPISIQLARDGELLTLQGVVGSRSTSDQTGQSYGFIGIQRTKFSTLKSGPIDALGKTGEQFGVLTSETIKGLGNFFSPTGLGNFFSEVFEVDTEQSSVKSSIAGSDEGRIVSVVGATKLGAQLTETGWTGLFLFLATINVFIGIFNLIPLLPLDGGHVMIAIYERLRSRKGNRYHADASKLLPLTYLVLFVLIAIGVAAIYLDIADPISL
jgi:membrane-associated protease RseP (regulator of RpoE activity)|tara:strand:+ start:10093 stop:11361 length:1269 start_codon:yes stop_codon:yes gene_type:complete